MVTHDIPPVYDGDCRILILGTMPSPRSRDAKFFYMHPRNRFWRVLGDVLGEDLTCDAEGKRKILLKRHIALWDVLKSCEIQGASDSSIKNETPNELDMIFSAADIRQVYTTGKTAQKLFLKHFDRECIALPSPSPANCAVSYDELCRAYEVILEELK